MVFDDETEFDMNENTTSNESKKKEPQLERYGVWIKKGPENLESPQEIPQTMDDSVIDNDLIAPEQEQIESIDEELDSLIGSDTIIEESTLEKDEISNTETILEPEIPSETSLPEGFDIPGIDLSAFENNDIIAPSGDSSGEVSIDMDDFFSSDSGDGEVDLSSLFGDGESIDFDDFMGGGGKKKEPEIIDEPPLNIELEFDDNFVLETKADPVSQVEFIGLDGESGEMSFDDLFDSIQDEGAAFPSDFGDSDTPKIPEVDISAFAGEDITSAFMSDTPTTVVEETKSSTEPAYDDASEFDDLLSSLDDATPLTETPEEAKSKKLIQDYDITVTMDEEDLSEEEDDDEDGETSNDDLDDISLFQSNEDIERFKQQAKNNGAPVGGMKVLEAQSSMDFDEIDKILEDGGFEFPSDEVKDVTQDETDDISLEETQLDDTSIEMQDFEVPSNQIEPNEDIPTEENDFVADEIDSSLETEIQEIDIEDSAPLLVEDSEQESTDESDFSISKPELNDDILIDEETDELSDDITLEDDFDIEPTTSFEDSIDIEDSLIEEENTDETLILDTDIEEDEIEANEKLDETFLEIEDDQVENTDDEIQSTQEDELLDMDFSEDAMEIQEENNTIELEDEISIDDTENTDESEIEETDINLISEEEPQEEEIQADTINETIQEEQGEITMEENGIINDEQNLSQNVESSNLLEKIAAEISNLRSEITNLRTEFNSFKVTPTQETSEEDISSDDNETSGFFSDDNEDETIALSGDELNNILNNADFTTEEAEEELVEDISDETVTKTEEDAVINPLGDATELTDSDIDTMDEYEDSSFADDSEVSNFANEDLQEPELEDLQMDNNFEEEDLSEEIDVPKDEEVYEEPETNDFIESINAEDPSISDTLTEDRLKYLEDSFEDSVDENEEKLDVEILDENENVIEDSTDEIENELSTEEAEVSDINENEEDESDESNEPTEDVFNSSQWDNDVTEPTEDNNAETESIVEDEIPEEIIEETENDIVEPVFENEQTEETVDTPVESAENIAKPASLSPTAKIQDDIKSVLVYMDQLLENLPEDKIEEFAKSEHFETYKKLFDDLGISN